MDAMAWHKRKTLPVGELKFGHFAWEVLGSSHHEFMSGAGFLLLKTLVSEKTTGMTWKFRQCATRLRSGNRHVENRERSRCSKYKGVAKVADSPVLGG